SRHRHRSGLHRRAGRLARRRNDGSTGLGWASASTERLGQYDEVEVISHGHAESFVTVRKRLGFASALIAAPLVPLDELSPLRNDLELESFAAPIGARIPFGLGQEPLAETSSLLRRPNGERTEVRPLSIDLLERTATDQLPCGVH